MGEHTEDSAAGIELIEDAARVFAARKRVDAAIADLASSPLDEAVADEMRTILASPALRAARQALARLAPTPVVRPQLSIVADRPGTDLS